MFGTWVNFQLKFEAIHPCSKPSFFSVNCCYYDTFMIGYFFHFLLFSLHDIKMNFQFVSSAIVSVFVEKRNLPWLSFNFSILKLFLLWNFRCLHNNSLDVIKYKYNLIISIIFTKKYKTFVIAALIGRILSQVGK